MTVINRALLKAYERQTGDASALEQHPSAVVRGWAKSLRDPLRPATAPTAVGTEVPAPVAPAAAAQEGSAAEVVDDATTATSEITPATPQLAVTPAPVDGDLYERANGARLRFDSPHVPETSVRLDLAEPTTESAPAAFPSPTDEDPPIAWPAVADLLLKSSGAEDIRQLVDCLFELTQSSGLRCVAFSGRGHQAGRTSLIVTLARALVTSRSVRVAIVDAHFAEPGVAQALSVRTECGLEAVLRDGEFDPRSAIWDLNDQVSIVPLCEAVPADHKAAVRLQSLLRMLEHEFDLVLVDAGPWDQGQPPPALECRAIDAFVSVARAQAAEATHVTAADVEHQGIHWLGQIDTFVNENRGSAVAGN
ncbi:MAG: hypothetical protein JSS02_11620 [Planctomycetes bacterium]|nr:hypothetical protein [Planctomycetota bacterium]